MKSSSSGGIAGSVLALSVVVSLLIGLIGGFFIGEARTESKYKALIDAGVYSNNSSTNNGGATGDNSSTSDEDRFSSIDYSQFKINDDFTVDSYYGDDETKFYASQMINRPVPELKWTDSSGTEHSTAELGDGKYLIEFFSPTCTYCNQTIPELNKFRENSGNTIISLAIDSGDLTNFNADGEHAWLLDNQGDTDVSSLLGNIPWIPTFCYVENGIIKLVTYGGQTEADFISAWEVAFPK